MSLKFTRVEVRFPIAVVALSLFCFLLSSGLNGSHPEASDDLADPVLLRRAERLYDEHCSQCHFPTGNAPLKRLNLVDDQWRRGDGSLQSIMELVAKGVSGTQMEPFRDLLSDEEIRLVSLFVRRLASDE